MSIKINGTEIGSSIELDNTDLSEIVFNGVSVWKSFPEWDTRGLEYNSWDTIQKYIQAGLFSTVASVGQTKSFKINGKTYNAEVVAINDGSGSAGAWYPNRTVDFITKELYQTTYRYNSSNDNTGGFPSSEIKNTLNNTIYPLLPSDLKSVIIDKSHSYQSGYSIGSYGAWQSAMTTLSTKLWFPTNYEIFGTTDRYAPGEDYTNNKAYTLASKLKKIVNGSSYNIWWSSSPYSYSKAAMRAVGTDGNLYTNPCSDVGGVPICFRIG